MFGDRLSIKIQTRRSPARFRRVNANKEAPSMALPIIYGFVLEKVHSPGPLPHLGGLS
jgi:hypothetical protein